MKKVVIVGATSGIGRELVNRFIAAGWKVGIAGRRSELLQEIRKQSPDQIEIATIDIVAEEAPKALEDLITRLGGMDLFLHSSGIGEQNPQLELDIELKIFNTNVLGFARMIDTAYKYFEKNGVSGQIAAITSVAGTKGIGVAAAYSASKRFQSTYIDALAQLARKNRVKIRFTDIKPGFVATPILKEGKKYPMLMTVQEAGGLIFRAIIYKRRWKIVNWKFWILVRIWNMIPQWVWERLVIRSKE